MAIEFELEDQPQYLSVVIGGSWDRGELQRLIVALGAECRRRGYRRALADLRAVEGQFSDADRFFLALNLADQIVGKIRLAALFRVEMINKFGENTAVNRGAEFFVTSDRDEALSWLLEGKSGIARGDG
jgi:hypothetical protein